MRKTSQWLVVCAMACALAAPAARAGDEDGPLMWLAWAKVDPGGQDTYVEVMREAYGPVLDGLMKSGDVLGWGLAGKMNHDAGPGHVMWITVRDWAAMDRLNSEIDGNFKARRPGELDRLFGALREVTDWSAHTDWIVRHTVFHWPGVGDNPPKFIMTGTHAAKGDADVMAMYDEYIRPIYDDLMNRGVIHSYGVYEPELHDGSGITHVGWVFLSDLGKMDAARKAFEKLDDDEEFNEKVAGAFEPSAHRDGLWSVLHHGGTSGK